MYVLLKKHKLATPLKKLQQQAEQRNAFGRLSKPALVSVNSLNYASLLPNDIKPVGTLIGFSGIQYQRVHNVDHNKASALFLKDVKIVKTDLSDPDLQQGWYAMPCASSLS